MNVQPHPSIVKTWINRVRYGQENVPLARVRIRCSSGQRGGIQIKSTLDNTHKLDHVVDEDISFTDDDLIAIKNNSGTVCKIIVTAINLRDGRRAIFLPSRQAHFQILDPTVSGVRSTHTFALGDGETCMLRTNLWRAQLGNGAVFPV